MGLTGRLAPWAFRHPRVYGVAGPHGAHALRCLEPLVGLPADTPRDADVLVVAGDVPDAMIGPLRRTFAALPAPRTAMRLGDDAPGGLPYAALVGEPWSAERLAQGLAAARRALLEAPAPLEATDEEAGGVMEDMPAGRPMADTGPDPDDLWLDRLPVRVGPFHHSWPSGLQLDLVLQGDRIVSAELVSASWARAHDQATDLGPDTTVFVAALRGEPQRIEALESARAASHLRWAASVARLCGLDGQAQRLLLAARSAARGAHAEAHAGLHATVRACERGGSLRRRLTGTGTVDRDDADGVGGPVARASGSGEDLRRDDDAYRRLGFEPVSSGSGDAWARWWVRTREALASLELASRAGDERSDRTDAVEGPRGPLRLGAGGWGSTPSARAVELLPRLLEGCEWTEMIDTVVSLDIDPDEAGA